MGVRVCGRDKMKLKRWTSKQRSRHLDGVNEKSGRTLGDEYVIDASAKKVQIGMLQ